MSNLQQNITRGQGVGLMATTLLGTGVFILPQLTVEIAGQGALVAWLALTLAILPLVRVFAELGRQFPHAAGPAYFVEQGFGGDLGPPDWPAVCAGGAHRHGGGHGDGDGVCRGDVAVDADDHPGG